MALTDESRKALVQYLELIKGGVDTDKRVSTRYGKSTAPLHPMLGEALQTLSDKFADLILEDQDCFSKPAGWAKLLALLPSDEQGTCGDSELHSHSRADGTLRTHQQTPGRVGRSRRDRRADILIREMGRIETRNQRHLQVCSSSKSASKFFCMHGFAGP